MKLEQTQYGFKYGPVAIERLCSDPGSGWVAIGIKTAREDLTVYITKTGKVSVRNKGGTKLVIDDRITENA